MEIIWVFFCAFHEKHTVGSTFMSSYAHNMFHRNSSGGWHIQIRARVPPVLSVPVKKCCHILKGQRVIDSAWSFRCAPANERLSQWLHIPDHILHHYNPWAGELFPKKHSYSWFFGFGKVLMTNNKQVGAVSVTLLTVVFCACMKLLASVFTV